jgi:hypothetical protein
VLTHRDHGVGAQALLRARITDSDVEHVVRNPIRLVEQEGDYTGRLLVIGADTTGRLLEVVVVPADDPQRVIHANLLQRKNYDFL